MAYLNKELIDAKAQMRLGYLGDLSFRLGSGLGFAKLGSWAQNLLALYQKNQYCSIWALLGLTANRVRALG